MMTNDSLVSMYTIACLLRALPNDQHIKWFAAAIHFVCGSLYYVYDSEVWGIEYESM